MKLTKKEKEQMINEGERLQKKKDETHLLNIQKARKIEKHGKGGEI